MTGRGESPHHARVECGTAEQPAARDGADDDVWHGISLVQGFRATRMLSSFVSVSVVCGSYICKRVGKARRGGTHSLPRTSLVCQREHRGVDLRRGEEGERRPVRSFEGARTSFSSKLA